jgi:glutathione S-transferase
VKLIDAPACPFCARARIALAEKGLEYERVEVDLRDRPQWVVDLNPPEGRVPVLDDEGLILPESDVIMTYLEESYPENPLLTADLKGRAKARIAVTRFDEWLGRDYYAFRRGVENDLPGKLAALPVGEFCLYTKIVYAPWVIRARDMLGVELPANLAEWLDKLAQRPAFAAEIETVRSL